MAFYDCQRCGDDGAGSVMEPTHTLFGGARAKLCPRCLNVWTAALRMQPFQDEHAMLLAHEARLDLRAHAGDAASQEECIEVVRLRRAIEMQAFEFGLEFIRPIPREQAQLEAANAGQTYPMSQRRLN